MDLPGHPEFLAKLLFLVHRDQQDVWDHPGPPDALGLREPLEQLDYLDQRDFLERLLFLARQDHQDVWDHPVLLDALDLRVPLD